MLSVDDAMNRNFIIGILTGVIFSVILSFIIFIPQMNHSFCSSGRSIDSYRNEGCKKFVSEGCNISPNSISFEFPHIRAPENKSAPYIQLGTYSGTLQEFAEMQYGCKPGDIDCVKLICQCPGY